MSYSIYGHKDFKDKAEREEFIEHLSKFAQDPKSACGGATFSDPDGAVDLRTWKKTPPIINGG